MKQKRKKIVGKDIDQEKIVIECLQSASKPLKLADLAEYLDQDPEILEPLLQEMEAKGQVIRTRKNRYGLPEKMNLIVGTIQGHPKGYGFLLPDSKQEDIFISRENMDGAMHGDRVVVRPLGFSLEKKHVEGEVIRVLERANTTVVGTFEEANRQFGFVVPDDKRLGWDIFVPTTQAKGARNGDKVVVEITSWPRERRNPEGRIIERFGAIGEPGVDILSIVKKYGLPEEFPRKVLKEAEAIPQRVPLEDMEGRWDLDRKSVV